MKDYGLSLVIENELPTFFVLLDVDNESFFHEVPRCRHRLLRAVRRTAAPSGTCAAAGAAGVFHSCGKTGSGKCHFSLMGAASWFAERACLPCGPFLRERKSRIWCALLYGTSLPYGTVFLFLAMDHAFWRKRAGGRMVIFIPCGMPWRVLFLERHRGLIKGKRFSRGC